MVESEFEYDVCLSFAGEDRSYVEQVAAALDALHVAVFYDQYEQVELWGKDLYVHLDDVYRKRARYCVIFISEHYGRKLWTSHERRSAQARAFAENREYILPARFDDTEISGILPTVGSVFLKGLTPEAFAGLIKSKIDSRTGLANSTPPVQFRRIYYEGFDCGSLSKKEIKAKFGGLWLVGKKGHWQGDIANGVYQLSNLHGADALLSNQIRYYEPDDKLVGLGDCRVSARVRVAPPNDGHSGAGLLFRSQEKENSCYAFFLQPGSSVSLAEIRQGKLRFLWSQEIPEVMPDAFVTLKAACHGSSAVLHVNGSVVHTIEDAELLSGNVGTIALSIGQFTIDDFAIYFPQ